MLLLTEETSNTIHNYYKSSNVLYSEYNKETNDLLVAFKNKTQYIYHSVPESVHLLFMLSESNGKFFVKQISSKYKSTKLNELLDIDYINEIFKTKKNEI